ncbi:hypothetical protein OAO87_03165, partial [bacterium]|nr:hypothetical protein [bacterium]
WLAPCSFAHVGFWRCRRRYLSPLRSRYAMRDCPGASGARCSFGRSRERDPFAHPLGRQPRLVRLSIACPSVEPLRTPCASLIADRWFRAIVWPSNLIQFMPSGLFGASLVDTPPSACAAPDGGKPSSGRRQSRPVIRIGSKRALFAAVETYDSCFGGGQPVLSALGLIRDRCLCRLASRTPRCDCNSGGDYRARASQPFGMMRTFLGLIRASRVVRMCRAPCVGLHPWTHTRRLSLARGLESGARSDALRRELCSGRQCRSSRAGSHVAVAAAGRRDASQVTQWRA